MVMPARTNNQASSSVQRHLEPTGDLCKYSIEDSIAVVSPAGNEWPWMLKYDGHQMSVIAGRFGVAAADRSNCGERSNPNSAPDPGVKMPDIFKTVKSDDYCYLDTDALTRLHRQQSAGVDNTTKTADS